MPTVPYGSWPSPISAAEVARARVRLGYPTVIGDHVWWEETRPQESGRVTVMHRAPDGRVDELVAAHRNARTRVHEYGGRSYLPVPAGRRGAWRLVFANYADQRLYLTVSDGTGERPLTPEPATPGALRYADFVLAPDGRAVWCVRESHTADGTVTRAIVAVPLDGSAADDPAAVRELVSGADFYAFPTPSPDGRHLAWICWNHPDMPWDATELRVAPVEEFENGVPVAGRPVLGGAAESVLAPLWRDSERLYAVSDRSGWWNLYEIGLSNHEQRALCPAQEEFGAPLWELGGRPFGVLADGRLAVVHGIGDQRLGLLEPQTGKLTDPQMPYPVFDPVLCADGTAVVGLAGGPACAPSIVRLDVTTGEAVTLRSELDDPAYVAFLPTPYPVEFENASGQTVHALAYPPTNPAVTAPDGESPPYIVQAHGGPTGHGVGVLNLTTAYFTSRGIGVLDVNYGGSTGYGRAYRERLRGRWGVVDVQDVIVAARAFAATGRADPGRLAIRGASAGGWTALAAVTTGAAAYGPVFAAAVSYFGISDPLLLAKQVHDFESHYLDGLIGPLPESAAVYRQRSPLRHVGPRTCPVLLLQGEDDPVVPPAQSEAFVEELAAWRIPYAYLAFAGESHGFRRAETAVACLEGELSFYGQILGFDPPGVPPLAVDRAQPTQP